MNIIKEKRELVTLGCLGMLLLVGGLWDKQISQGLMNQESIVGTFFKIMA